MNENREPVTSGGRQARQRLRNRGRPADGWEVRQEAEAVTASFEELVEQDPEREYVAPLVHDAASSLLG